MPIVVFDLEGVLIDNSERLNYALRAVNAKSMEELHGYKRGKFWKIFMSLNLAKRMDKVNDYGLRLLSEKSQKYRIAIVSGTIRRIGLYQLELIKRRAKELNLYIKIDSVFLRPERTRIKAVAFKESILRLLMLEDTVVEIHDDDEDVIEMAKKYKIRGILWRNLRPVSRS